MVPERHNGGVIQKRLANVGRSVAVALALLLAVAACAPHPSTSVPGDDSVFAQAIADAIAGGASDTQVQILRDGRDAGALTLEDVKGAVGDTFACFEDAGIGHSAIDVITQEGLPRVSYNYSGVPDVGEDQSLALADSCMNANSLFVEFLYISQPRSRGVADRFFTDHVRTPLIDCLQSLDVDVDDSATNDEVWQLAENLAIDLAAPYASGDLPGLPTDCVSTLVGDPGSWGR